MAWDVAAASHLSCLNRGQHCAMSLVGPGVFTESPITRQQVNSLGYLFKVMCGHQQLIILQICLPAHPRTRHQHQHVHSFQLQDPLPVQVCNTIRPSFLTTLHPFRTPARQVSRSHTLTSKVCIASRKQRKCTSSSQTGSGPLMSTRPTANWCSLSTPFSVQTPSSLAFLYIYSDSFVNRVSLHPSFPFPTPPYPCARTGTREAELSWSADLSVSGTHNLYLHALSIILAVDFS